MFEEIIESHLRVHSKKPDGSAYFVDCPYCIEVKGDEDNKGHMKIFTSSWMCHCFRCGTRKHIKTLLSFIGVSAPQQTLAKVDLVSLVRGKRNTVDYTLEEPPEIELPDGTVPLESVPHLPPFSKVYSILKLWEIDVEVAVALKWCWNGRMNGFVYPCYMNGKVVYYAIRKMSGERLSCPGDFSRFGIIYNFDCELKECCDEVYIVEGPKDSAMCFQQGIWAVALLGHRLSPFQSKRLSMLTHKKVVCLDGDVTSSAATMAKENGWCAAYLPKGDPADWSIGLPEVLKESRGLSNRVKQLLKNKQVE